MSGAVALQALVSGLGTGAAYGLIALGFTLVRRLTGVLAFAHGDVAVGAGFLAVLAVVGTTPIAPTPAAAPAGRLLRPPPPAGRAPAGGAAGRAARARAPRGRRAVGARLSGGAAAVPGRRRRGRVGGRWAGRRAGHPRGADPAVLPGGVRDPGRAAHHRGRATGRRR